MRFGKRDAISLLRTSLSGRPLELIKGIGSDYGEHLDAIYGDPRFIADSVTHDISKFKPLRESKMKIRDFVTWLNSSEEVTTRSSK